MMLYLGPAAVEALPAIRPEEAVIDGSTQVFGLHPDTIRRRLQQAARAAGIPGWRENHRTLGAGRNGPGPVGGGVRPPRADDGGQVEVSQDAGAVHRAPGSRTGGRWSGTTRAAGGRGSAALSREAGGSEVAAVFGSSTSTPQGSSGRPLPGCFGTLYAALWVGVILYVHHSFWRVGPLTTRR